MKTQAIAVDTIVAAAREIAIRQHALKWLREVGAKYRKETMGEFSVSLDIVMGRGVDGRQEAQPFIEEQLHQFIEQAIQAAIKDCEEVLDDKKALIRAEVRT